MTRRRTPASEIDRYLAKVPEPARTALEHLRKTIRAAAPESTEAINYGMPTFRQLGMLVGFRATARHCAFYLMSGTVLSPFNDALGAYDTSKGTIRFQAGRPLPVSLVKKIVRARIAENLNRAKLKASKSSGGRPGTHKG